MKNLFKEQVERNEKPVGIFFGAGNYDNVEALALTDMDYIIIDAEHGPFDVESVTTMLRSIELHDTTAFVRVKDVDKNSILKMLDIGAKGLIIPQVQSLEEVEKIVEYGKYYPIGRRGVAFYRSAGFGEAPHAKGDLETYFKVSNENTLIIPQCETLGCLEDLEEIVKVEGVDGIFVGPYDLTVALGIPGDFDNPKFEKAMEKILKTVHDAGKFVICFNSEVEHGNKRLRQGFDSVTIGIDTTFYIKAINDLVSKVER